MKSLLLTILSATTMLTAAPQAVVFDFGGVITGEPNREAVAQFLRESFHLSKTEFETINQEKKKLIKAGMTEEEFWTGYAKNHKIDLPPNWSDTFSDTIRNAMNIRHEIYGLVDQLKEKQFSVALFSNIDSFFAKLIRKSGLYDAFDPCVLSYEIGANKPNEEAYHILLKRLDLPASDIVFIDDKLENIEKAKELGIDGIVFESYDQIVEELKKREIL